MQKCSGGKYNFGKDKNNNVMKTALMIGVQV
jgi:hypothetical protein